MMHFLSRIKLEHWVVLAAILGVLLFQALPGPRPLDDAYITFRYARSISQGQGFSYNPGEHVQGTTTPLYTLLLAGLASLLGAQHLV
jgi:arabinofuranosyltransferase